jgi:hypothetical protein
LNKELIGLIIGIILSSLFLTYCFINIDNVIDNIITKKQYTEIKYIEMIDNN